MIPTIIHQLSRTEKVPAEWAAAVASVKRYHPGWEHRIWTDAAMEAHVRAHHPEFFPVYMSFRQNIMRVDTFRYVLMHDIGGLYCDLDYEFLRPYDYSGAEVVLPYERQKKHGHEQDVLANCVFASAPGHAFWRDCIADLVATPPETEKYVGVVEATGPQFLTRVFEANQRTYEGVRLEDKLVFIPFRVHGRYERKHYRNNGITCGFHYGWGTWKDRWSQEYWLRKVRKVLRG